MIKQEFKKYIEEQRNNNENYVPQHDSKFINPIIEDVKNELKSRLENGSCLEGGSLEYEIISFIMDYPDVEFDDLIKTVVGLLKLIVLSKNNPHSCFEK